MLRLIYSSAEDRQKRSLDDEALGWVVLLTSGDSTEQDHQAFRAWRDQSPSHAEALSRARTLWTQVGEALPRVQQGRAPRTFGGTRSRLALAASVLLCIGLSHQYMANWRYDIVTGAGESRVVQLADGSRVIIAGDTALDIDFSKGTRRIELARGRGLFEAVHDETRPFIVHAGGHSVRDIGTIFEVSSEAEGARVVVAEGAVEASSRGSRKVLLTDQAVTMNPRGLGEVETVNSSVETAWSQGRLIIQNKTLEEILEALAPHYRGRIILLNSEAGRRRLSVAIDLDHVDDWLAGLAKTKAVRMARVGNVVVLT